MTVIDKISTLCFMEPEDLVYFNPFTETKKTANFLPHWQQTRAAYFITYRLADAVPATLRERWMAERAVWLRQHPKPWTNEDEMEYHRLFTSQIERWLDAGHGSCALRDPEIRVIVEESLCHFDGTRYVQHAWVIMPNHVHVLASLNDDWEIDQVLHTWKSFTAHQIRKELGKSGAFWQEDYFDRLVRDAQHFDHCVNYIRRNPVKAGLKEGAFTLFESEFVKKYVP